jgi:hypothetical protein
MDPKDVKPEAWRWDKKYLPKVLYNEGETGFSIIWGKYKEDKTIGVRWNGNPEKGTVGTPSRGLHPTWFVVPNNIGIGILNRLLELSDNDPEKLCNKANIKYALEEIQEELKKKVDFTSEIDYDSLNQPNLKVTQHIAERIERKLNEQLAEFNNLRDRILIVIGFSVALITIFLTYLDKFHQPMIFFAIAAITISILVTGVLIYAAVTIPLHRGLSIDIVTGVITDILNDRKTEEDFNQYDVSANLDSFTENAPKLEKLRGQLNGGLVFMAITTFAYGLCVYLNNFIHG